MDNPGQTNSTSNSRKTQQQWIQNPEISKTTSKDSTHILTKIRKALSYSRQWKQPSYGRLKSDWQLSLFARSKKKNNLKSLKKQTHKHNYDTLNNCCRDLPKDLHFYSLLYNRDASGNEGKNELWDLGKLLTWTNVSACWKTELKVNFTN